MRQRQHLHPHSLWLLGQALEVQVLAAKPEIEQLLSEQTSVILQAVDERFVAQEIRILAAVDRRLEKMEQRFAKSLDELTKTLDKFLKRMTDLEEEFTFMKEDLKRVKACSARETWCFLGLGLSNVNQRATIPVAFFITQSSPFPELVRSLRLVPVPEPTRTWRPIDAWRALKEWHGGKVHGEGAR